MCMDCGCMKPNDDHGDARHITAKEIAEAAKASEIGTDQAILNIQRTFEETGKPTPGRA